jgi:hypothetical protein
MEIHFFPTVKTPASSYINITSAEKKKKRKAILFSRSTFSLFSAGRMNKKNIYESLFLSIVCVQ